jgi:hypothetical protein
MLFQKEDYQEKSMFKEKQIIHIKKFYITIDLFPTQFLIYLVVIVVIFYKFTFVEFLMRQKIACHERIHLKFTKRIQL